MSIKKALPFTLYIPLFLCLKLASGAGVFPEPGPSPSPSASPSAMPSPIPSASPSPLPQEKPVYVTEKGKPVQLVWKDGRVATLMISRNPPVTFPVPMDFFENACTERLQMCTFQLAGQIDKLAMKWTAHSEPAKIGQTLTVKQFGNTRDLKDDVTLTAADKIFDPTLSRNLPDDEIFCNDFSFLPGGTRENPPQSVWISRWDSELMFPNGETDANENRVVSGAVGVELIASDHKSLKIIIRQNYTSIFGSDVVLALGDVVGWQVRQAGAFCQMSFRPDANAINPLVEQYQKNLKDHFEPYVFGTDEYSKDRRLFNFHSFLDVDKEFEIQ